MNAKNLFGILFLLSVTLVISSCEKEDKVDISQLTGKWGEYNDDPRLSVDGSVRYTFDPGQTCSKHIYDALSGRDTTIYYSYVISYDHHLITLYNEDNIYAEQYNVLKLTSKEMTWEDISRCDCNGKREKKLVRLTDE